MIVTSLLIQPAVALGPNLRKRFVTAKRKRKIRSGSKLTCGGQEKNEQDSGIEVVHGRLTKGGDSILDAFFCEPIERVT